MSKESSAPARSPPPRWLARSVGLTCDLDVRPSSSAVMFFRMRQITGLLFHTQLFLQPVLRQQYVSEGKLSVPRMGGAGRGA